MPAYRKTVVLRPGTFHAELSNSTRTTHTSPPSQWAGGEVMAALPRYFVEVDRHGDRIVRDRNRQGREPFAFVPDAMDAERIARLLNADLERTERQGAVVP